VGGRLSSAVELIHGTADTPLHFGSIFSGENDMMDVARTRATRRASSGEEKMDRRKFLKRAGVAALGSSAAGMVAYPFLEAKWCRVVPQTIVLPNLPSAFRGTRIALMADVHHGPFVPLAYIRHVVSMANALKPDIALLAGDYVHRHHSYIEPGISELGKLQATLGRFAVRGNHDNRSYHDEHAYASSSTTALALAGLPDLNNTGVWIERGGARLRICGVGDLWTDRQNLSSALGDATEHDAVILLSHNPDFAETIRDRRVGLVLSGHTHGGQVVVPGLGAPIVPSRYGQKYLYGLVQAPSCQVFITRGVGTITPPARIFCRPEVVLITLI
jgi:predicted MPP superfamily phosphohydrolase